MPKEVTNMLIKFMPKSILRKWSFALAIIGLLINMVFMILVALDIIGSESPAPWMSAVTGIPVIAAFVTGIIAFVWSRERSMLVYLGLVLLVLLFVLGEFLFPH
jgi:4-amino-4-deoxy-L-arabinose transferase-like glycosyltransferase